MTVHTVGVMPKARFLSKFADSLADGTFVRLVLPGDPKITARLVELKGVPHLSLTFHHATKDVTKNIPISEAVGWVEKHFAGGVCSALLGTTQRDWQLTPKGLVSHRPAVTTAPPRSHDQPKQMLLDDSARDWLDGLGVSRPAMADKRRQIERYMEILSHLLKETPVERLADMGCGKGYLTFGAWHLFHRIWQKPVRITGVEARPELVEAANKLARKIGAVGLEFVAGTIQSVALPPLDALIALHACDTATDDAIRRGIESKAKLIVVAPCCHKEVRRQWSHPEPLGAVLQHGIMEERLAEWATDGLRALHLEAAGYRTKLFEFVSGDHTPKNLMLAAIRTGKPGKPGQLIRFREFFGIKHHALD
ncbi:MAG: SAM-dependent methyltransferase [Verrucomicrobia bacterium]|nr:SAM-dependent methyltransferase [Verrucomicrobiota bacterium]